MLFRSETHVPLVPPCGQFVQKCLLTHFKCCFKSVFWGFPCTTGISSIGGTNQYLSPPYNSPKDKLRFSLRNQWVYWAYVNTMDEGLLTGILVIQKQLPWKISTIQGWRLSLQLHTRVSSLYAHTSLSAISLKPADSWAEWEKSLPLHKTPHKHLAHHVAYSPNVTGCLFFVLVSCPLLCLLQI